MAPSKSLIVPDAENWNAGVPVYAKREVPGADPGPIIPNVGAVDVGVGVTTGGGMDPPTGGDEGAGVHTYFTATIAATASTRMRRTRMMGRVLDVGSISKVNLTRIGWMRK